eukprot:s2316_g8.t1
MFIEPVQSCSKQFLPSQHAWGGQSHEEADDDFVPTSSCTGLRLRGYGSKVSLLFLCGSKNCGLPSCSPAEAEQLLIALLRPVKRLKEVAS